MHSQSTSLRLALLSLATLATLPFAAAAPNPGHRLLTGYKEWTVDSKWSEKYEAWNREFVNPADWRSPDYYNGNIYLRFEVLDKPTDDELNMQLCLWYGDFNKEGVCEVCIDKNQLPWFTFSKKGDVVYVKYPPVAMWPQIHGRPWNNEPFRFMLFQLRLGKLELKVPEHPHHLGAEATKYIPVKWHAEAYLVPAGDSFVPPTTWTNHPWSATAGTPE